eukprot:TRINITY_DN35275_c0_g1_i1.p3 TRINITY_DN35275_c0_g1~~TRINITY_DN35275_c0_g1_i1.p3  ORF type:complete len:105 (-),score=13.29 TRINITY_DN35275_c0_g1_i1:97-411(-)
MAERRLPVDVTNVLPCPAPQRSSSEARSRVVAILAPDFFLQGAVGAVSQDVCGGDNLLPVAAHVEQLAARVLLVPRGTHTETLLSKVAISWMRVSSTAPSSWPA